MIFTSLHWSIFPTYVSVIHILQLTLFFIKMSSIWGYPPYFSEFVSVIRIYFHMLLVWTITMGCHFHCVVFYMAMNGLLCNTKKLKKVWSFSIKDCLTVSNQHLTRETIQTCYYHKRYGYSIFIQGTWITLDKFKSENLYFYFHYDLDIIVSCKKVNIDYYSNSLTF